VPLDPIPTDLPARSPGDSAAMITERDHPRQAAGRRGIWLWGKNLRLRLSIVTTLALSFGTLIVVAMSIAVYVLFNAAQSNTRELIATTGQAVLAIVSQNVRYQLDPTRNQLQALGRFILSDNLDLFGNGRIRDLLLGSLASDDQLDSLLFVRKDLRVMSALRVGDGRGSVQIQEMSGSEAGSYRDILDRAIDRRGAFWGTPFYSQRRKDAVIPLYVPVRRGASLLGVLRATVAVPALSRRLDEYSESFQGVPFALDADGFVIAHPDAGSKIAGIGHLMRPADLDDPVLAAFHPNNGGDLDINDTYRDLHFRVQRVTVNGADQLVLYRPLEGYEDQKLGMPKPHPWIIGVHVPDNTINSFVNRVTLAAGLGIAVMLLGVGMSVLIGRRIARPIARLAQASEKIARLDLDDQAPLRGSRLREVDVAVTAFNRMRMGLGWLATYVPRSLLPLLVQADSAVTFESKERDVTILFTDIIGFTTIGQKLDAPALAAFLNRHFSLLEEAIAAEGGTIDKYIGDSIMAFWGAPIRQPDHIQRACRAALAIAEILKEENERRVNKDLRPVRVRIGIETGMAIAGNIGAPSRINYTLVGDKVNLAQRFEQFAKTVDDGIADAIIIISDDVAAALPPDMPVEPLGPYLLPGREEEIKLYRLLPRTAG